MPQLRNTEGLFVSMHACVLVHAQAQRVQIRPKPIFFVHLSLESPDAYFKDMSMPVLNDHCGMLEALV